MKKVESVSDEKRETKNSSNLEKNVQREYPVPRCRGLRPAVGNLERDLWCWYSSQSTKVPKHLIQMRARWAYQQAGIQNFKASDGWLKRWMKRWSKFSTERKLTLPMVKSSGAILHNKHAKLHKKSKLFENVCDDQADLLVSFSPVMQQSDMDNIVTPSLGDTLDCSFPCMESSRLSVSQTEDLPPYEDHKDEAKLSTPIHDSFEQYSRNPKSRRLKDTERSSESNCTSEFSKWKAENTTIEEPTNDSNSRSISQKRRKGSSSNLQVEYQRTRRRDVGKRYHPQFKERVLAYLKSHTIKETAHRFGIHQGSVSGWQKDKLRLKVSEEGTTEVNPISIDAQFLAWLRRERGNALSAEEVCAYAQRLVFLAGGIPVVERQLRWFAMWVSRFDEKYVEGMENNERSSGLYGQRILYPLEFRNEVAAYAAQHSQMAAVRTFNVPRKRVFEWLHSLQDSSVAELPAVPDNEIQQHRTGRAVTDVEIDQQVWQWYCENQNEEHGGGCRPTSQEVRAHAAELYATRGLSTQIKCSYGWFRRWCERFGVRLRYSTDDELLAWALAQLDCNNALSHAHLQQQARQLWKSHRPGFKASSGWAIRFCKRHPDLLQRVPTVTTALPDPLKPLVAQFRCALRKIVCDNILLPKDIGNMDELPLGFSAPPSGTPKRQLLLRKPGMDSCHATIVLSCLADGTLLPTMLILKDDVEFLEPAENLVVIQQNNGIMDLACMRKWLELVWFPQALKPSLLVADSFGPHCAPEVASDFVKEGNKKHLISLIPAGCSSKLQPLDVSVKQTFQRYLHHCWERLNTRSGIGWTCGQQLRLPSPIELIQWVAGAHHYVMTSRQETIRRSFLVTGLLVADNHSEDHFIENPAALPTEEDIPDLGNVFQT